jgi:hypothetical protein
VAHITPPTKKFSPPQAKPSPTDSTQMTHDHAATAPASAPTPKPVASAIDSLLGSRAADPFVVAIVPRDPLVAPDSDGPFRGSRPPRMSFGAHSSSGLFTVTAPSSVSECPLLAPFFVVRGPRPATPLRPSAASAPSVLRPFPPFGVECHLQSTLAHTPARFAARVCRRAASAALPSHPLSGPSRLPAPRSALQPLPPSGSCCPRLLPAVLLTPALRYAPSHRTPVPQSTKPMPQPQARMQDASAGALPNQITLVGGSMSVQFIIL